MVAAAQHGSALSEGLGARRVIACDVADESQVDDLFERVVDEFGTLDIVVNNAGIALDGMLHRVNSADARRVLDVNVMGTLFCLRAAFRIMRPRDGGSIVNVSSIAAKSGNLGQISYAASKGAVESMTRTAAREGARHGIRVNAVRPGLIRTDMTRDLPTETMSDKLRSIPLGRAGEAGEVAETVAFLASAGASYLTGSIVDVAGGREM